MLNEIIRHPRKKILTSQDQVIEYKGPEVCDGHIHHPNKIPESLNEKKMVLSISRQDNNNVWNPQILLGKIYDTS